MYGNQEHKIWVEKYRPSTLEGYIGNPQLVDKLKVYVETQDIPHILLYGTAGQGKSTAAKIIVNSIDCDYMYINASDENSVETVRSKIKNFAATVGFKDLKIIICDEFDFMTANAQAALRNLMETFSRTTRFILTCNYIEKVIDPIISRCQVFSVTAPDRRQVAMHVAGILEKENVKFNLEDIVTVINASYPDIRKIINSCQKQTMNGELVIDKQSLVEANYMTKILELLKSKSGDKDNKLREIRQLIADSQVRTFEALYTFLFDNIDIYAKGNEASAIIALAEYQNMDAFAVNKEICINACMVRLVKEVI